MATTEVKICNMALIKIGASRITSLSDLSSTEARECNAIYEILRDEVLESFHWTFAMSRAVLAQDADAPEFGYDYSYLLPSDCLSPVSIAEADTVDVPYVIEGRSLLTNSETVNLRYIKSVTDPAFYPSSFVACLSLRMAVDLSLSVAKSTAMSLKMAELYRILSPQYKLTDARRDTADAFSDTTTYLDARS